MEFFDRNEEIAKLQEIRERSIHVAQLTVLTGRRRIGKTSLVLKAYGDAPFLYFFVSSSSESELCQEFAEEMTLKTGIRAKNWIWTFSKRKLADSLKLRADTANTASSTRDFAWKICNSSLTYFS